MTIPFKDLVRRFGLAPHPEGGFFARTYTAPGMTAIHYLLPAGDVSRLHRLKSDEMWLFHAGAPLAVVEIAPGGALRETRLGPPEDPEAVPQHVVRGGRWFGARLAPAAGPDAYAFVSCAVTPPFDYGQFELARRQDLLAAYPQHAALITALTGAAP